LQSTRSGTGLRTDLLKAVAAAASTGFAGTVPGNTNRGFSTEKVWFFQVHPPTVFTFTIPEGSFGAGFKTDYQSQLATWPDLANSTDFHEFEKFVTSAHALVRTWLALELVSRLERFVYDPLESPAIAIRGLPVEAYVPPTEKDCLLRKTGNYASETLLVGISRIVGQPFQMGCPDPSSSEMEILIGDIYSIPEHDNEVHYSHRRDCISEFPHVVSCRIPNMSYKTLITSFSFRDFRTLAPVPQFRRPPSRLRNPSWSLQRILEWGLGYVILKIYPQFKRNLHLKKSGQSNRWILLYTNNMMKYPWAVLLHNAQGFVTLSSIGQNFTMWEMFRSRIARKTVERLFTALWIVNFLST